MPEDNSGYMSCKQALEGVKACIEEMRSMQERYEGVLLGDPFVIRAAFGPGSHMYVCASGDGYRRLGGLTTRVVMFSADAAKLHIEKWAKDCYTIEAATSIVDIRDALRDEIESSERLASLIEARLPALENASTGGT